MNDDDKGKLQVGLMSHHCIARPPSLAFCRDGQLTAAITLPQ
jgi:hypothetical protein